MKILTALLTMLCLAAAAGPKPYTLKSHQVNEDADYMYYSDDMSDGTEKTRKVKKPKPPEYPSSVTLIATNDFPVQVQYVYVELYPTGRVATNYQYRTKSARERAVITLPPMPELVTAQPRGKKDAFGHALRRSKEERELERIRTGPIVGREEKEDRFIFTFENGETKTHLKKEMSETFIARARKEISDSAPKSIKHKSMKKEDRIIRRTLVDGKLRNEHQSGAVTTTELKRAFTSRVKSAPVTTTTERKDNETSENSYISRNHNRGVSRKLNAEGR